MGFEAIRKKSAAMGKSSSSTLLKVNKYSFPKAALDLIGHICTSHSDIDVSHHFEPFLNIVEELRKKCEENGVTWGIDNFYGRWYNCVNNCLKVALEANTYDVELKIAVAGGYSSGKSTFLNALTNNGNMLPTGIEPVSVVNTYLNCSSKIKNVVVKGENLSGDLVLLNQEVLDCIRHSKESQVNVACALNKIVIDLPSSESFNGITFIDTPGYNNSSARNTENSTTDREMALSSFNEADVIFWCVDIENGAITEKDFEVLSKADGKQYVIVFTKKDKKSEGEIKRIVDQAYNDCIRRFGEDKAPIDVVAYSDRDSEDGRSSFFSKVYNTLEELVEFIKVIGGRTEYDICQWRLNDIFDNEDELSVGQLKKYQENKNKVSEIKASLQEYVNRDANAADNLIDELRYVMIDLVNDLLDAAGIDPHDYGNDSYFRKKNRFELIEAVSSWVNDSKERGEGDLKLAQEKYKECQESIRKEQFCQQYIAEYRVKLSNAMRDCYEAAKAEVVKNNARLQSIAQVEDVDVFTAISADNYEAFLASLSKGVDLSQCNAAGYNVITWIAQAGNNQMMRLILDHKDEVDISVKDKNGYNVLETAAICHYKDICQMLIEADNSLVSKSQPLVKLAEKNDFSSWVSKL